MSGNKPFDAYHELLGIAPSEQPPNFYRLLGITAFESNPVVIERAADRQMAHLRGFQLGLHSAHSQRLLNEISQARLCLLNDAQRAAYESKLRLQMKAPNPPHAQQLARAIPLAQSTPQSVAATATKAPFLTPENKIRSSPSSRAGIRSQPALQPKYAVIGVVAIACAGVVAVAIFLVLGRETESPSKPIAQHPNPPVPAPVLSQTKAEIPLISQQEPAKAQLPPQPTTVLETPPQHASPPEFPGAADLPASPQPTPLTSPVAPPDSLLAQATNEPDFSKVRAEVAVAKEALAGHPKFKKYYDFLQANPDALRINGPKLAAMLMAEAKENSAIREHPPSQLAALQEVERLATAGLDYQLAIAALDAQVNHALPLLTAAQARTAKGKLLANAAEAATAGRAKPPEREALLVAVRELLPVASREQDLETLDALLTSEAKLCLTAVERTSSLQITLPLAESAIASEQGETSRLLLEHLDALVLKLPAGKSRKEATDAITGIRKQFSLFTAAATAKTALAANPADPKANQTMALYLLNRGNWRESLPHWESVGHPDLRLLAMETVKARTAGEKILLADRWAAREFDEGSPGKEIARQLFKEAILDASLVGIARAAAEEKLKALGPSTAAAVGEQSTPLTTTIPMSSPAPNARAIPLNKPLNLLPLVDIVQDSVHGSWANGPKGSIQITEAKLHSRLRLPIDLSNCDYDLTVEFNLGVKAHSVHVILPVGERSVQLIVDGYDGPVSYFDLIGGLEAKSHKKAVWKQLLMPNRAHRYDIRVRLQGDQAHLAFSLNGEPKFEYSGPISELQVRPSAQIGTTAQPALAVSNNLAEFTSCQVKPLTGEPKLVRDIRR